MNLIMRPLLLAFAVGVVTPHLYSDHQDTQNIVRPMVGQTDNNFSFHLGTFVKYDAAPCGFPQSHYRSITFGRNYAN